MGFLKLTFAEVAGIIRPSFRHAIRSRATQAAEVPIPWRLDPLPGNEFGQKA